MSVKLLYLTQFVFFDVNLLVCIVVLGRKKTSEKNVLKVFHIFNSFINFCRFAKHFLPRPYYYKKIF